MATTQDPRRHLPAVDALLATKALSQLSETIAHEFIVHGVREELDRLRDSVINGKAIPDSDEIAARIAKRLDALRTKGFVRVINATGIILHTGLGRAPLTSQAREAIQQAAGYCNLEIQLDSGTRGNRQDHVEDLLRTLTGCEAALVVNNNAAAVYLVLNSLAYRKDVIVSRGQLIEIGGSFRLPDIMSRSGVKLVEVGTTNRTRIDDYKNAVTKNTAILLHAHPSNYRIRGFSESATIAELAEVGKQNGAIVVDDLGNGLLWDWSIAGLPYEANVKDSLEAGADLVLVSGDKILGGPQAGIILGRKNLIQKLSKSPLARVLRIDKLSLSALRATLSLYLNRDRIAETIPSWNMLLQPPETVKERANRIQTAFKKLGEWRVLEIRESEAETGSGSLPDVPIQSYAVCCLPKNMKAAAWAKALRTADTPVVGTVRDDMLWLDMRTVSNDDEALLINTVRSILQ